MWKKTLTAAAVLLVFSIGTLQANEINQANEARLILASDGIAGDYFIICASTKSRKAAKRKARRIGYYVIRTNDYPNLRNGYYAVVQGPFAKFEAKAEKPRGCYVKSGW